jgi:hypothetical protein
MTDRERWIVYPLLFLALGAAVKDKIVGFVDQVKCKSLVCNAVVVVDGRGREQVVVSSDAEGGLVRTYGNKNGLSVGLANNERVAGLVIFNRRGGAQFHPNAFFVGPPARQPASAQPAAEAIEESPELDEP